MNKKRFLDNPREDTGILIPKKDFSFLLIQFRFCLDLLEKLQDKKYEESKELDRLWEKYKIEVHSWGYKGYK